jgi:isopentenyl-diphosphate delta-isomerase
MDSMREPPSPAAGADRELVVLVDEADRVLGAAPKDSVHHAATPLHRGFSLFLFDRDRRLLLQRRSALKRTWPLVWSNSCCGHPGPGESAVDAARRRARAELGVEALELRTVLYPYRYRFERDGVAENEICPLLVGRVAGDPRPDPAEVAGLRWLSWPELLQAVAADAAAFSPWCVEESRLLAGSPAFTAWLAAAT